MLRTRIIPSLLLDGEGLVKTKRFKNPVYLGDASNTCRIFNQMEVDELVIFDIRCSSKNRPIQYELLQKIASECFMPICYGGGVKTINDFKRLFTLGVEKVSVSSLLFEDLSIIHEAVNMFGSQSIIATIDVRSNWWRKFIGVYKHNGKIPIKQPLQQVLETIGQSKVGELIVNNIDREGTWEGFDIDLMAKITDALDIPVVSLGGGGNLGHISEVINVGKVSAVALGSMSVFQAKDMGVLINFPTLEELEYVRGKPKYD